MSTSKERRSRRRKIVAACLAGALLVGWMFVRWVNKDEPVGAFPATPPAAGAEKGKEPDGDKPSADPSADPRGTPPAAFGGVIASGLQGGSQSITLHKHTVVLRAWSARPMAFAAWYVPTRPPGKTHGAKRLPGKEWSMTTVAYGEPDYAQLYLQTDVTGEPVHCSITVDGKVTARETTEGPYGTIMCQG